MWKEAVFGLISGTILAFTQEMPLKTSISAADISYEI
jgi:hypothetical protein